MVAGLITLDCDGPEDERLNDRERGRQVCPGIVNEGADLRAREQVHDR